MKDEIIFIGKLTFPGELHLERCQWHECEELATVQIATMEQASWCFCWKHFKEHMEKLRRQIHG